MDQHDSRHPRRGYKLRPHRGGNRLSRGFVRRLDLRDGDKGGRQRSHPIEACNKHHVRQRDITETHTAVCHGPDGRDAVAKVTWGIAAEGY
jgi:hypothetical protein